MMSDDKCVLPNCHNTTQSISIQNGENEDKPPIGDEINNANSPEEVEAKEQDVDNNKGELKDDAPAKEEVVEEKSSVESPEESDDIVAALASCKDNNITEFIDTTVCRLCMSDKPDKVDIFDKLNKDIDVASAIMQCIPLIKISRKDNLSKVVCCDCLATIRYYYKFRNSCIEMDQRQRRLSGRRKRKYDDVISINKKLCEDSPKSELDKKFDMVEAELKKALEENSTEEVEQTENIIIQVQSDEEEAEDMNNIVKIGSKEIKLPKGIKVSVNQVKVGLCKGKVIKSLFDFEFCLCDGYLFEFRLTKGNVRHLRCVAPRCFSSGEQYIIKAGVFEENILVKIGHNHSPPTDEDIKKQMFFQCMRRKMQSDKTLNFRAVYDSVCQRNPEMGRLVPLRSIINQICCQQMTTKFPIITTFDRFYDLIETDELQKLHFTLTNRQFYQERFQAANGAKAVVFANCDTIEQFSNSKIMYVDSSFKIETKEPFQYYLLTILIWVDDSYYPIMFALISEKSQEIFRMVFAYLYDVLAPNLRPEEIVTDYEASLYYSIGEVYADSHIGGSVFYYTQNLYKKICSLDLARELETNSSFRNIYHMILMLPLLPVNTIQDGLNNIELQACQLQLQSLTEPIFQYVKGQWMEKVTPELFCVHRLENRINENVIAPFKKLRDFLMLSKGKMQKQQINILTIVEKLIELEGFLQVVYTAPSKRSFARDLSSYQKKNVLKAWQFIENHPKININHFFGKVLGYIKCMENQLWIWGFYRYSGDVNEELINAANFSIVNTNDDDTDTVDTNSDHVDYVYPVADGDVIMDVIINHNEELSTKEV